VVGSPLSELRRLDERIGQYDRQIPAIARVGSTTATAILAVIGSGHEFRCGRRFAASIALVRGHELR
jgi:transposase